VTSDRPQSVPQLDDLFAALERHDVDFVVIGGMAGLAHGSSYPSFDLDIAYGRDRQNIERLVAALAEIGVSLRGAPEDLPFQLDARTIENGANFTFATPLGDLDVLADIAGIRSYADLRRNAETKRIAGHDVLVASIDHLIAMKRAANRPKDQRMLEDYIVIADEQQRLSRESQGE
jgi:hypothetical protein